MRSLCPTEPREGAVPRTASSSLATSWASSRRTRRCPTVERNRVRVEWRAGVVRDQSLCGAHQDVEAGLREMRVCGGHVFEHRFLHHLHTDAISQAPRFVAVGGIARLALSEDWAIERYDSPAADAAKPSQCPGREPPKRRSGEEVRVLEQDRVRRDEE